MKNLLYLKTPKEVKAHAYKTWRSRMFKANHNSEGSFVNRIVDDFARLPRAFADMSMPLEASHFSTWFGVILNRNPDWYKNDENEIHDLYYLHEYYHAATMTYDPNLSFGEWYNKMTTNEFEASLASEVLVYFEMPGLRERTFNMPIWVDRLLKANNDAVQMSETLKFPVSYLREKRLSAMQSPNPLDYIELQMHNYIEQNQDWARVWRKRYSKVEANMKEFIDSCNDGNRDEAIRNHDYWLHQISIDDVGKQYGTKDDSGEPFIYPYDKEMKAFSKVYQENKKLYGNS